MPSPQQRHSLQAQVETYHANLTGPDGGEARAYLADRGLYQAAADRFRLGHTGENGDPKTANRLVIPYLTPAGPWHLKYRCLAEHDCKEAKHAKYIYDDGAEQHLYNASTLLTAERVAVVEGELDAVAVEMAGVPAVAYPGADTWKKNKHWRWAFDSCVEIVVIGDGDVPREGKQVGVGEEAARSVADSLRSALPDVDVRVHVMPVGHDSNSFLHANGTLAFLDETGLL